MNDAELDTLARRASEQTRADARALADSESALRRLLDAAAAETPTPLAPLIPYHGPIRDVERRRRWKLVAVAGVIGLLALGIVYANVNGSSTIEVAGPPSFGTGTATGPTIATTAPPSPVSASPTHSSVPGASQPPSTAGPSASTAPVGTSPVTTTGVGTTPMTMAVTVPDLGPVNAGEVPRLLLRPATPASVTYAGEESIATAEPTLTQVWVRPGDGRRIDAFVVVHTRVSDASGGFALGAEPVEVPGWDAMRTSPPGATPFTAELVTGNLVVDALVSGLDEAASLATLRDIRSGGARYALPSLDTNWVELPSAWSAGVARRELIVLDEEGDLVWSIDVSVGDDLLGSGFFVADVELELTEAAGHPAVLQRAPIPRLIVLRDDGVVIRVGSRDPGADVVAAADSLIEVDEEIWAESTTPRPNDWVGCLSFFC